MREGFLYFNGESLELMQEPKEASFFFIEPGGNELKISSSEVNIRISSSFLDRTQSRYFGGTPISLTLYSIYWLFYTINSSDPVEINTRTASSSTFKGEQYWNWFEHPARNNNRYFFTLWDSWDQFSPHNGFSADILFLLARLFLMVDSSSYACWISTNLQKEQCHYERRREFKCVS